MVGIPDLSRGYSRPLESIDTSESSVGSIDKINRGLRSTMKPQSLSTRGTDTEKDGGMVVAKSLGYK